MLNYRVSSGPASEPVTAAEAKEWLKLRSTFTADDTLISSLIETAREQYEHSSGEVTITRTVEQFWSMWPSGSKVCLLFQPVSAVSSVQYRDDVDGTYQTFSSTNYTVDLYRGKVRIVLNEGADWPSDIGEYPNAVKITYVCGYASAAAVPESAKTAIKAIVSMLYYNRSDMPLGGNPGRRTAQALAFIRKKLVV